LGGFRKKRTTSRWESLDIPIFALQDRAVIGTLSFLAWEKRTKQLQKKIHFADDEKSSCGACSYAAGAGIGLGLRRFLIAV
jgi:hypothetical protein